MARTRGLIILLVLSFASVGSTAFAGRGFLELERRAIPASENREAFLGCAADAVFLIASYYAVNNDAGEGIEYQSIERVLPTSQPHSASAISGALSNYELSGTPIYGPLPEVLPTAGKWVVLLVERQGEDIGHWVPVFGATAQSWIFFGLHDRADENLFELEEIGGIYEEFELHNVAIVVGKEPIREEWYIRPVLSGLFALLGLFLCGLSLKVRKNKMEIVR